MFSIDLETYSEVDIKHGIYKYARSCELMLFGFCDDSGEVHLIDLTRGEKIPAVIEKVIKNNNIKKFAWNATFERLVLANYYKCDLKASGWDCTQVRGSYMGLNLKLETSAEALETSLKLNNRLVQFFCKPNSKGIRHKPEDYPEKWEEFRQYCMGDVRAEFEIRQKLKGVNVEHRLYALDGDINDRGIKVNMDLVNNCIEFVEKGNTEILEQLKDITRCANPNSVAQLKNWLLTQGINTKSLDKASVNDILDKEISPVVRKVLELKKAMGSSSTKKYQAIKNAEINGRIHGMFQFCGATRTHRWAGRIVQPQNLYRNHEPLLKEARDMAICGVDPRLLFDNDILSQLIRTSFEGPLTIADFSSIEARVIAWLSSEQWLLDTFAGDGKVYEMQASKMYHVPVDKVTKELRAKGKIATLALGYGGSIGALRSMGYEGTDEDLLELKDKYRMANPNIVTFWYTLENYVKHVITTGEPIQYSYLEICRDSNWLYIILPSKHRLCYFKPRIEDDSIIFTGTHLSVWTKRIETFGGKLAENVTQAIARDCLAIALLRCKHMPIVGHIHDEILVEGDYLNEMLEIMSRPIDWAPGLILKGDGFINGFYRK